MHNLWFTVKAKQPQTLPKTRRYSSASSRHDRVWGEIHSHDHVCLTYYKSHLVLLKENKRISKDSDLKQLIGTYCQQIRCMEQVIATQDVINTAMAKTLVTVGKVLFENRAMLLPSIHSIFTKYTAFITGRESQGTLADTGLEGEAYKNDFIAFLHLRHNLFQKACYSFWDTINSKPLSKLFSYTYCTTIIQQHKDWLEDIRQKILQIVLHLKIALEEEVTADITRLDTDTVELIDWVFCADMEDTASMEDDEEVVA